MFRASRHSRVDTSHRGAEGNHEQDNCSTRQCAALLLTAPSSFNMRGLFGNAALS
jgi:hypothetical protein